MPATLRWTPRALGKTGSEGWPRRSRSHVRRSATVSLRRGVQRSFRPFPRQRRLRTASEVDVLDAETGQLGASQSRLDGDHEQRMVPPTGPAFAVGCGEQGLDFGPGQIIHLPLLEFLVRHRQHPMHHGAPPGLLQGHVAEKGTNRREPDVARTRRQATRLLGVIEERADQRGIEILQGHPSGRFLETVLGETEELPKRVAIADNGVRAHLPLAHKAIREEGLEEPRERGRRGHRTPPRSTLVSASRSSWGMACRYQ